MKNQPAIYLNSQHDYENKGLTGRWINVPVSNEQILKIMNELKVHEDDTIAILDYENMCCHIDALDDVEKVATTIAKIAKRINQCVDSISDIKYVEYINPDKIRNIKKDVMSYVMNELLPSESEEYILNFINTLTFRLTTPNDPDILYDMGYEAADQMIDIKTLPNMIKNNINYKNIGRDEILGNPDVITYKGDLENGHLDYIVY